MAASRISSAATRTFKVAQQGASSGYSDATPLTPAELEGIGRREARVYRGAAALFPLSERLRRSFIEDFGIPPDRIKAIYAGPNFDVARVPAPSPRHGQQPPTVLFVGRRYYTEKGATPRKLSEASKMASRCTLADRRPAAKIRRCTRRDVPGRSRQRHGYRVASVVGRLHVRECVRSADALRALWDRVCSYAFWSALHRSRGVGGSRNHS